MPGSEYSYGERAEDRHYIRLILAGQDNLASFEFCFQRLPESEWQARRSMAAAFFAAIRVEALRTHRGQPDRLLEAS